MPNEPPTGTSRFGISVDGVPIASFSELQGITTKVDVTRGTSTTARSVAPESFVAAIGPYTGKRGVTFRLGRPAGNAAALGRLAAMRGRRITLTAFDRSGRALAAVVGTSRGGGNDVLQQEWTLTYETIQRVL